MKAYKQSVLALIVFFMNASWIAPSNDPGEYRWYYEKAIKCFDHEIYSQAVVYLDQCLALNPKFDSAYYERASARYMLGNYALAIDDCNKAIKLNSKYVFAHARKGMAQAMNNLYSDSLMEEFLSHKGDKKYFRELKARYRVSEAGVYDLGSAIKTLTKAIELNDQLALAYEWRAYCYGELEQLWSALQDYHRAIELDPKDADLYGRRGFTWAEFGNLSKASYDYDKAIFLEPSNGLHYYRRGTYFQSFHMDKISACMDYAKADSLGYNIGSKLVECGNFSEMDSMMYDLNQTGREVLYPSCSCPSPEKLREFDTTYYELKTIELVPGHPQKMLDLKDQYKDTFRFDDGREMVVPVWIKKQWEQEEQERVKKNPIF